VAVLWVLGVAAAYYASGRLGLLREVVVRSTVVTPLWPPTGIALAALLVLGIRIWPGIALGALFIVVTTSGSVSLSGIFIVAGNTLAPVCAFLALRRVGFRMELNRLRDGVLLVFLGAIAGMFISATVGAGVLMLDGRLSVEDLWPVWAAWWAGDAMGVLMVTPLLLVLRRVRPPRVSDRWMEATVLTVVTVVLAVLATRSSLSMLYLVFPVIVWAALRFELAGSAPCALLVSAMAVIAGTDKVGPFGNHAMIEVMLNLTVLNSCVALTALLLAAIVTEHKNIRRETERACEELASLVEELAPRRMRDRRAGPEGRSGPP
jgi:integral membrane sensor domain MASE1